MDWRKKEGGGKMSPVKKPCPPRGRPEPFAPGGPALPAGPGCPAGGAAVGGRHHSGPARQPPSPCTMCQWTITYESRRVHFAGLSVVEAPDRTVSRPSRATATPSASWAARTLWSTPTVPRCAPAAPRPCTAGPLHQQRRGGQYFGIHRGMPTAQWTSCLTWWRKRPPHPGEHPLLTIEEGFILYSTAASNETVTLTGPSSELAGVRPAPPRSATATP